LIHVSIGPVVFEKSLPGNFLDPAATFMPEMRDD